MSVELSTKELITLIRSGLDGRNQAIEHLYSLSELKGKITSYVLKKGGNRDEAEDVYVDAIIAFIKNAKKEQFTVKQTLNSYLFGTAKYIWFGKIRKQKITIEMEPNEQIPEGHDPLEVLLNEDQKKWIHLFLNEIDDSCKKVLTLWAHHYNMKEIKDQMQYKSEGVARKKKYLCLKKLYQLIADKKEWANRLREI